MRCPEADFPAADVLDADKPSIANPGSNNLGADD